jgi:two-component system cell cycle sensor histidine kinase PleC
MDIGEANPAQLTAHERKSKLALDQLALALRNLGPNHILMPIFTAIICLMFRRWVDNDRLVVWFVLVSVSVIPLGIVTTLFWKYPPQPSQHRAWIIRATAAYFVFAAAWVSMGVLLWVPHDDLNHLLIILFLAGTLAGNSALVSPSRPMVVMAFLTSGLAAILTPLQEGGTIYDGVALLAVFFVLYLAYMSRQVYVTARDMLMLRNDKNDLITELARSKSESDEARDRAEAASRAKSQFLANMSHELRTPLNAILGFSELISSRVLRSDTEKHREYAELIHSSGRHLLTLINDILDLAKIEAGGFALREVEIDLARLIGDALTLMAPKAEAGQITLAADVAPGLSNIMADERAIMQIHLNLLSNALKFTPAGGTVTAFARAEPDGGIAFGVRDTGVGIAQEDLALVFQNFGQSRHDIAIADKGTGLGLPIVKGLVEAHQGRIALESRFGSGTCVTVTLGPERIRHKPALRAAS